jgi:hypothetical protein
MSKSLVEIWKETYVKLRPWIAIIFVGALLTSIFVDNTQYKIGLLLSLAANIILLIFDLNNSLKLRLDAIDNKLKEANPPQYPDFNDALPIIRKTLVRRLERNRDVNVKILAVSSQFSWKSMAESIIPSLLKVENKTGKINIEIAIVNPEILLDWGQESLANDAKNTLIGEANIKRKYKTAFETEKLSLSIYKYDNIPHWHGILIDSDVLFMGRCKWEVVDDRYHLLVGQIDYRQFQKNDRFGGNTRIELVDNWFDAYRFRAKWLENHKASNRVDGREP